MKIVVDGNDGSGKTTLVAKLRAAGYEVQDRGVPTRMTDDESVEPIEGELYLILDCPVEVCRARLSQAGRDLNEQYHTIEDLTYYRERFLQVAAKLGDRVAVIGSVGSPENLFTTCVETIKAFDTQSSTSEA